MFDLKNKTPNILVIGDLMIDHYLWGACDRISPEAPVQVVEIQNETTRLGGAGNVIANLKALGANVGVLSVVGNDEISVEVESILTQMDVKIECLLKEDERKTSKKSRVMAIHQQVIRIDSESKKDISTFSEKKIFDVFLKIIKNYDTILLSDYGKGVLSFNLCQDIIKLSIKENKFVLVDPKGKNYLKYYGATLLTPNKKEASLATGIDIKDQSSLREAMINLKEKLALKYSLITLSEEGIAIYDKKLIKVPAIAREVYDVTGAGDTVLAMLGFALSCGENIINAIELANKAAAIVVAKVGSATASFDELQTYEYGFENKYKTKEELEKIIKNQNLKTIFTNGCFDILHSGHVKYLNQAKQLGDILIVGINSDNSVKRLKGKSRPINPLSDRITMLCALASVDYVVSFEEDTPYELISKLKPNILAKGEDYKDKVVVGSELVNEVKLIHFEKGKSTSAIIQRIKDAKHDK